MRHLPRTKVLAIEVEISGQDTAAELKGDHQGSRRQDQGALGSAVRRYIGCQAGAQRRPSGQETYSSMYRLRQTGEQRCGLLGQAGRRPSQARCGQGEP
jgi:hypothetical protein